MERVKLSAMFVAASAICLAAGCEDPQAKILKVFTDQGLTLVKPARNYIKIGGIVLLPKGTKKLDYEDPYDTLTPANGTSISFQAILGSETDTSSTGAQASVALAQMVKLPFGFKFEDGQTVKLSQIDADGSRYARPMISTLLKKKDTADEMSSRLKEGDRVFIIQEVYTATSLSVSSSTNVALAANVGGTPVTASCSSGAAKQGAAGQGAAGQGAAGQGAAGQGAAGQGAAKQQGAAGQGAAKQQGAAKSASTPGVSVGVCRNTSAELSFTSKSKIPFAVRLNEIEFGPADVLQVKEKNFHLPNVALGNDSDVSPTVLIDDTDPSAELHFIPHGKPKSN
jgi:hypothetical protein